jgi:hypothetical protein
MDFEKLEYASNSLITDSENWVIAELSHGKQTEYVYTEVLRKSRPSNEFLVD